MYTDLSRLMHGQNWLREYEDVWTIAIVRTNDTGRETHFGLFASSVDAREAMDSGLVTVMPDERLQLRRIRMFPTG